MCVCVCLIHVYKPELALNTLQWLVCHKTQSNQIIYNQYIPIKRIWHEITYNGWYAGKPSQTKSYIFNVYIYKEKLALNNLQWLICYKTKPTQTHPIPSVSFPICIAVIFMFNIFFIPRAKSTRRQVLFFLAN